MIDRLSKITGIGETVLINSRLLYSLPVAARMSWAANREATRIEDIAYSLLGIFDLNMPLLYGEEEKAFRRLQEEIIRTTNDLTILAWTTPSTSKVKARPDKPVFCGVLAESPLAFSTFGRLLKDFKYGGRETSVCNIGIKTNSPISFQVGVEGGYILPLDCRDHSYHELAIKLRKCGPDQFLREDPSRVVIHPLHSLRTVGTGEKYLLTQLPRYLRTTNEETSFSGFEIAQTRFRAVQVRSPPGFKTWDMWSGGRYDIEDSLFFTSQNEWGRDCAVMRVVLKIGVPKIQGGSTTEFHCVLYALGWSQEKTFRCSLVEYEKFRRVVDDLQSEMAAFEYTSVQLRSRMVDSGIPMSQRAVFQIPENPVSVIVSFKVTRITDLAICQEPFWRIELSSMGCHSSHVGEVELQQWTRD